MYGLAVNLIVSVSGHPWIIDEIWQTVGWSLMLLFEKCQYNNPFIKRNLNLQSRPK